MKSMKKVEIVFEAVYLTKILKLLNKHDIVKYSLIKDLEGRGSHGLKLNDDITCVGSNDYIFTLCEEEQFLSLKEELRTFIKRYGGKCFVTDTMMLL
jgi:nitrogen regulatory protein PII